MVMLPETTSPMTLSLAKTAMPMVPYSTAKGLPSLSGKQGLGIKVAQSRVAVQTGRSLRRLPAIIEVDCEDEDGGVAKPCVPEAAPCPPRPACLPESVTEPLSLVTSASDADVVVAGLKEGNRIERSKLLAWLFQSTPGVALTLACSEQGSCVLQAALEVAAGKERNMLVAELQGCVVELATAQHGHEVLMRLIEVMPSSTTGFVIKELKGSCKTVARHRHGCHVLNLLIMHFSEEQMAELTDEVLQDTMALSKNEHGSTVLQHLLEYGTAACQQRILKHLLPEVRLNAMDKTASHVLQQVLEYCEMDAQVALAHALLRIAKVSLVDVACSRCGCAVLRKLAAAGICVNELRAHLVAGLSRLQKSKYGRRVLTAFGLSATPCTLAPTYAACESSSLPPCRVALRGSMDACWHSAAAAA
mmetsp:Transcript_133426/g.231849  ORF Transcript_133426/g.231849 Transcript_133426/m.231849 type:complete len:418 (-) Transcript_133426:489-1742(-)